MFGKTRQFPSFMAINLYIFFNHCFCCWFCGFVIEYESFQFIKTVILCLHDLPSLCPKVCFLARLGLPFLIRGIPIQWERSGLQMADLNKRKNRVWGRREIVQTQNTYNQHTKFSLVEWARQGLSIRLIIDKFLSAFVIDFWKNFNFCFL